MVLCFLRPLSTMAHTPKHSDYLRAIFPRDVSFAAFARGGAFLSLLSSLNILSKHVSSHGMAFFALKTHYCCITFSDKFRFLAHIFYNSPVLLSFPASSVFLRFFSLCFRLCLFFSAHHCPLRLSTLSILAYPRTCFLPPPPISWGKGHDDTVCQKITLPAALRRFCD